MCCACHWVANFFPASTGEKSVKDGQYLAKIWKKYISSLFWPTLYTMPTFVWVFVPLFHWHWKSGATATAVASHGRSEWLRFGSQESYPDFSHKAPGSGVWWISEILQKSFNRSGFIEKLFLMVTHNAGFDYRNHCCQVYVKNFSSIVRKSLWPKPWPIATSDTIRYEKWPYRRRRPCHSPLVLTYLHRVYSILPAWLTRKSIWLRIAFLNERKIAS